MNILGNLIWVIFGGLIMAVEYIISGAVMCLTIIGIPFGLQVMQLGLFALWPFGGEVVSTPEATGCLSTLLNVIWIFIGGIWIALSHLALGVFFCITVRSAALQTDELCISTLRPHRSAPIEPQTGNSTKRGYLMPRYPLLSFKTDIFCYAFPRNAAISRTEAENSFSASSCSKVICTR